MWLERFLHKLPQHSRKLLLPNWTLVGSGKLLKHGLPLHFHRSEDSAVKGLEQVGQVCRETQQHDIVFPCHLNEGQRQMGRMSIKDQNSRFVFNIISMFPENLLKPVEVECSLHPAICAGDVRCMIWSTHQPVFVQIL